MVVENIKPAGQADLVTGGAGIENLIKSPTPPTQSNKSFKQILEKTATVTSIPQTTETSTNPQDKHQFPQKPLDQQTPPQPQSDQTDIKT